MRIFHAFLNRLSRKAVLLTLLGCSLVIAKDVGATLSPVAGHLTGDMHPVNRVSDTEQAAFNVAMDRFSRRTERDDFSATDEFLKQFPKGAWAPALQLQLTEEFYATGWYSRTLRTLETLWAERTQYPAPDADVVEPRCDEHVVPCRQVVEQPRLIGHERHVPLGFERLLD